MASGAMCGGSIPLWCTIKGCMSQISSESLTYSPFILHEIFRIERILIMRYLIHMSQKKINPHHLSAIQEYAKRLSSFCTTELFLSESLSLPDSLSTGKHSLFLVLPGPSSFSSEELADQIQNLQMSGMTNVHLLIGFTETQLYEAYPSITEHLTPVRLCISRCSLSADTCAVMLFEQLYRSCTILQGKTYHK